MDMLRNKLRRNAGPTTPDSRNGQPGKAPLPIQLPIVEVFQNHWRQALAVIRSPAVAEGSKQLTSDEVSIVIHNVEKMGDILVSEREENGQQGHCLVYLLAEDILDQLVSWCLCSGVYENKIKYELLKILESLISQSQQPLLYHKPVIRPLLSLLGSCVNTTLVQIEKHVILLLHQLCVCISRNPQYLELFFNVSYSSGQNNFLIFCLLIPYIHREGMLGQQARDALLLIMAASARNQVIGEYIANNSDFCPVLATGLSALYSSLPHKVRPEGHEDWYRIEKEHYMDMPDVQMIINCLEFCNAVVQVAHELVGQQLIEYIYNGFLQPVMAPALLQNAIEEQVSAIAYLELFVRTITEPSLLRAFLHFILTTRHDDVVILEWLVDRISSSTKLCMVSLSLFKTLIELNCEDVMFALCFKYLYRLTHVMQSQKRAIKQVDIYGNIAEKLLQLEPVCCRTALSEEQQKLLVSYNDGIFSSGHTQTPALIEDYKSSYMDYLVQAREMILACSSSCNSWCYVYDGDIPPYNASIQAPSSRRKGRSDSSSSTNKYDTPEPSLPDDVPLLILGGDGATLSPIPARPPVTSHQLSDDSLLIDITVDPVPAPVSPKSDDVPLCIGGGTTPLPVNSATDDRPLLELGDPQQSMTMLNLLLESQNQPLSGLVSPPPTTDLLCEFTTSQSSTPRLTDQSEESDVPLSSSPLFGTSNAKPLESFLSYLDDSIDHVTVDPDKSGQDLLQEVDSVIEEAEVRVRKRKESQTSATGSEALAQFETASSVAESLASLQLHPVDIGPQTNIFVDPRPKKKLPTDYNLSLDDSIDTTPTIGPFLMTLLNKLENMMNNSLSVNLLLTGLVTRIASYPQPLLRSFLLNHSLVFQPSIKSLIQVLTSVRTKVDAYAEKVANFNVLMLQARKIMIDRADNMEAADVDGSDPRQRSASLMTHAGERELDNTRSPGKRITDFFRRDKQTKQPIQPELVMESNGYRFTSVKQAEKVKFESPETRLATMNTKKAVYCALILEEFVKELAALSQEHAILSDEGYQTD